MFTKPIFIENVGYMQIEMCIYLFCRIYNVQYIYIYIYIYLAKIYYQTCK